LEVDQPFLQISQIIFSLVVVLFSIKIVSHCNALPFFGAQ
jgi:hypothetical protein